MAILLPSLNPPTWRSNESTDTGRGLVFHFRPVPGYDGFGSDTCWESTHNREQGSVAGAIWRGPTRVGGRGSVYFDGTDDTITFSEPLQAIHTACTGAYITVAMWIRNADTTQTNTYVFQYSDNDGAASAKNILNFIYGFEANKYETFWGTGAPIRHDLKTLTAGDTTWHHLLVTLNETTQLIEGYFDGQQVLSTAEADPVNPGSAAQALYFGSAGSANFFNGEIDDFRIYDRFFSAAEVRQLYLESLSRSATTRVLRGMLPVAAAAVGDELHTFYETTQRRKLRRVF